MKHGQNVSILGFILAMLAAVAFFAATEHWMNVVPGVARAQSSVPSPTHSSPIAITSDDQFVWSVNPDNDSVSVFNVAGDANQKVAEIAVGKEPWCVAITPDNTKVYVTNMASGTVSVINAATQQVIKTIAVGTEPFGCAVSPEGDKLYVANQSSESVSVIGTKSTKSSRRSRTSGASPMASQ
jgi:YVTN family beta-propeller protein